MALCDINLINKLDDGKQGQKHSSQLVKNGGQRHAKLKMPLGKTGQQTFRFRPSSKPTFSQ